MFAQNFNTNSVVGNLIIINVLAFIATWVMGETGVEVCGLGYKSEDVVLLHGALYMPGTELFRPWQLLTHMFLHGSLLHIFFNMYALWMFGSILERVWGPKRFFIYYFVCGFGASLLYLAVAYYRIQNPELTELQRCLLENGSAVGASGAVFGLLLAFGMLYPNTELMLMFPPIPIKAKYFVAIYGLAELFFGMRNAAGDNVAHFAHLGGMIFGFILVKVWSRDRNNFY